MPLQWAHSLLWKARANTPAPVVATTGGYPRWQSSVIAGSLLGGLMALRWDRLRRWWTRVTWVCSVARRAWRWSRTDQLEWESLLVTWEGLTSDRRLAMRCAMGVVQHPAWTAAQTAVHETAHTDGFNRHQAWAEVGHALKAYGWWADNLWRHLRSAHVVHHQVNGSLTNPERSLLVELAYHEFAASGRGKRPRMQ